MSLDEITNNSIFEGEETTAQIVRNSSMKILRRDSKPPLIETVVKALISTGKLVLSSETKVPSKVTKCVSPSEIWVQDIIDSNMTFEK